jgi:2-methylcitrate dehydratase
MVACLENAKQFGGSDARCSLIGGGKANVVYASQYNTALVRYIDFMDSYLSGIGLCHPSDNLASIIATSEHAGRSGKEFLTALAVAYQVEAVLTANCPFMPEGFDLTTQSRAGLLKSPDVSFHYWLLALHRSRSGKA